MSTTLDALIIPPTRDEIRDLILAALEVAGLPVTSWQPGSIPILIIEGLADAILPIWQVVAEFAKAAYGSTSSGLWLELWGQDRFQKVKSEATSTEGVVTLTDAGGGPHNVTSGALIVSTPDGRRFISTASVTVPLNTSATVAVRAAETGANYNVPVGTITTLVTDLPSCSVSNPALSGSETWITSAGADRESDAVFYSRCLAQWATLSVATPKGYYEAVAKAAAPTVTKVYVRDDNPHGPGTVELVLATGAGPASVGDVALVDSAIQTHRSVGAGATTVVSASAVNVNVTGTVYVKAANLAAATLAIASALTAYQVELPIGGTVLAARIVKDVMSQAGVRDFDPTGGVLTDTTLAATQVATLTDGLVYVAE